MNENKRQKLCMLVIENNDNFKASHIIALGTSIQCLYVKIVQLVNWLTSPGSIFHAYRDYFVFVTEKTKETFAFSFAGRQFNKPKKVRSFNEWDFAIVALQGTLWLHPWNYYYNVDLFEK